MADTVETSLSASPTTSVFVGEPGKDTPKATSHSGEATSASFEGEKVTTTTGLGGSAADPEESLEEELEGEAEGTAEADGGEEGGEEAGELEDLGEYDPTNEETISKFDARYVQEDGTLDVRGSLSREFWANAEKGVDGLNEATYAYLKDRFGVDKDTVKDIEAAQKAQLAASQNVVHERFGGKEKFEAAMEWARKGGYTKAQRDRFNAITKSNDPLAVDEALTALQARFEKANPSTTKAPERRPVRPARDVTSAATRRTIEPYASRDEWAKDFREARDSGSDSRLAEVRRRLKVSPWNTRG